MKKFTRILATTTSVSVAITAVVLAGPACIAEIVGENAVGTASFCS